MNWEFYKTPEKVLRAWKKGMIATGEFQFMLLQTLKPDTLDHFVSVVPEEELQIVKEAVEAAPDRDEEWGRFRIVQSGCGPWNEEIAARVKREDEESIGRYRIGVETFRDFQRRTKR
jgi:hypothetical protein